MCVCVLQLNVVEMFMLVALDEGPGPAIKYQYAELGRLYQVVSQLIRSCDVSQKQQSSQQVSAPHIHQGNLTPPHVWDSQVTDERHSKLQSLSIFVVIIYFLFCLIIYLFLFYSILLLFLLFVALILRKTCNL